MVVKLKNGTVYHEQHFLMPMEMKEEINQGGNPDPRICPYSHDVYKSDTLARRAH